jgi:hypothetical protein
MDRFGKIILPIFEKRKKLNAADPIARAKALPRLRTPKTAHRVASLTAKQGWYMSG